MLAYLCLSKVIRRTRTTCPPYWLLNKLIVDELHGTMSRCVAHLVSDKFLCIRRILLYFHMSVCLLMFWGWLRVSGDRPQLFFTGFVCVCVCGPPSSGCSNPFKESSLGKRWLLPSQPPLSAPAPSSPSGAKPPSPSRLPTGESKSGDPLTPHQMPPPPPLNQP